MSRLNQMSVVFDHIIFSLQEAGGISEWWYQHYLQFLNKKEFLIKNAGLYSDSLSSFRPQLEKKGLEFHGRRPKFWYLQTYKSEEPYEIFHSSYLRRPSSHSVKSIFSFHDKAGVSGTHFRARLKRFVTRQCLERASVVHCISEFAKKQLFEVYHDLPKTTETAVVYHGLDFSDDLLRPAALKNLRQVYVLWVGGRAGYKNSRIVWNALRQLPNVTIIFVGGEPLSYEETKIFDDQKLKKRVLFLKRIQKSELNWLYKNATALWYPSLNEGFGFPPLEALRWSCPVLAGSGHAVEEICGQWCHLNQNPTSEWLVSETNSILSSATTRETILDAPKEIEKNFSWNRYGDQMAQIYKSLL